MTDPLDQQIAALERRLAEEPRSPLFARLAEYYLQAGRASDALRTCDEGLAHHPFYTTAHIVKGKALLQLKMLAEAKREFDVVLEFLPNNQAVAAMSAAIDLGPDAGLVTTPAPVIEEETPAAEPEHELQRFEPPAEEVESPTPPVVGFEVPAAEETAGAQDAAVAEPIQDQAVTKEQPVTEEEPLLREQTPEDALQPESHETESVVEEPGVEQELPIEVVTEERPGEVDAFGLPVATPAEAGQEPQEIALPQEQESPDMLAAFGQPAEAVPEVAAEPPEEENPFAFFGTEEEPFDQFAARTRMEFLGSEDQMTLEEYLGSDSGLESGPRNDIEELAEKLKSPAKITPVINFAEKESRPVSEADTPAETGFVTPTLAEIYAKQGWYDDAIKAYRTLALTKPAEREKFEQRIAELEELKRQQGG